MMYDLIIITVLSNASFMISWHNFIHNIEKYKRLKFIYKSSENVV